MIQHRCLLLVVAVVGLAATVRGDFSFTYNGRAYTLVTAAKNWDNAHADAVSRAGALARINDAAENNAILTNLTGKGITPTASDGGGSIYVWIGGKEMVEGAYAWINQASNAATFWAGGQTGSATNGCFANWGTNTLVSGAGPEPDNFNGIQNRTGFALEAWPKSGATKIGQSGQWNDINGTDVLAYLVEHVPRTPSNLAITVTSPTSLNLSWADSSIDEDWFHMFISTDLSGQWSYLRQLPPNSTGAVISGLAAGTIYAFTVIASSDVGDSGPAQAFVTTPGLASRGYHPAVVGQPFAYTLTASSAGGAPTAFGLTGALPQGLAFDPGTHRITGIPGTGGVFTTTMSAQYPAWGSLTKALTLRVIYPPGPPVSTRPIPKQIVTPGGPAVTVPLNTFFTDRDTEAAARFVTTRGSFDLALYASTTPQTVSNFFNYVGRGDYSNCILHRSVTNLIVQGGGFKPAPPNFTKIPTDPSPTNEPGISNLRGTVAMAKAGGKPHSATDQWFVSLSDNSANLDNQNGGFTAFGRVCGNGMRVADAIAALPTGNYSVNVDGQNALFENWPMDTAPPAPLAMDQSKLVLVNSVSRVEPLAYAVTGSTFTGLVMATTSGPDLTLTSTSVFGGNTTLTLNATDLDGNTLTQSVLVEVSSTFASWLNQQALEGSQALPGADLDHDSLPNAVEFALMGSPVLDDAATISPVGSVTNLSGSNYVALSFKLRKDLSGAGVILEANPSLAAAGWTAVWTSADPTGPPVLARIDGGDYWFLKVHDTVPLAAPAPQRFLRLRVNVPP